MCILIIFEPFTLVTQMIRLGRSTSIDTIGMFLFLFFIYKLFIYLLIFLFSLKLGYSLNADVTYKSVWNMVDDFTLELFCETNSYK